MLDMLWKCDRALRLSLECPAKMQSKRAAVRKHAEEPFDKRTSEYYSCGRKGVHGRKVVPEFAPQFLLESMHIADEGELHGHSSALLDTDGSDVSSADADTKTQPVSPCALSYWSPDDCLLDKSIKRGKIKGLSHRHPAEDQKNDFDTCYSVAESSPLSGSSVDSMTRGMNKMYTNFSASHRNADCAHEFASGFSSQTGLNEEDNKCGITISALSSSPARGGHRRTFPPPLSSVAMQSYCDKRGRSPGACSAGACLRSFRCNGRFVLQEVKAPSHKYFRVLRGDGRLKMELVNAENDSSAEEDEVSASGVCGGVDNSDPVIEMIPDLSSTSKVCAKDACEGSTCSSDLYGEATFRASSQLEKPMSLDSKAGISTEGYEIATDLVDTPAINTEKGKPLICAVPEALSTPEAIASETPSSPRCLEIRPLYSSPSPRIKSSWVRPISAF